VSFHRLLALLEELGDEIEDLMPRKKKGSPKPPKPPKPPGHGGPPPGSIVAFPSVALLDLGQTLQAHALIFDKKGELMPSLVPKSWASDNNAVASVDPNGLVTGVSAGSANITALFDSITSNVVAVTVTQDQTPASIEVTPTSASLTVGQTVQLTAVVKNAAGEPI
jgi:hypothetical protein